MIQTNLEMIRVLLILCTFLNQDQKEYACTPTIWLSIQQDLDVDGEAIQGLVSLKHCKSIQALKALTKCKACHMIQYSNELQL